MTLQEFISKYTGVPCGDTPENQGQCVGLIEVWIDVLGGPHDWGNAKDLLTDADKTFFDVILNTPTGFPLPGDIMVWDATWGGGYGHTGVIVTADANKFTCFEQNNPTGHAPIINSHSNYNGVLGWLHPKATNTMTVDQTVYSNLVGKATKYDAFVSAGYQDVDTLNTAINGFKSQITSLSATVSNQTAQVTTIQGQLDVANEQAGKVAGLQSEINDLTDSNTNRAKEISALQTANGTLQTKLDKALSGKVPTGPISSFFYKLGL